MYEKYENEINLLELFKEGKITEYAFQQELSNFVGSMSEVHLADNSGKNTASSYAVFTYPEKHINGIKIIYLINKDIISNNFYKPEELITKLAELTLLKQKIIKEHFRFQKDTETSVVTLGKAVAFFLRIYTSTLDILKVKGKDFLPENEMLTKAIISLDDGKSVDEIIESLVINNILPEEVLVLAKKLVHDAIIDSGEIGIEFVTDGKELPTVNLGQQEIRDLCTGTFGRREHKEIKYNYKPSTNQ